MKPVTSFRPTSSCQEIPPAAANINWWESHNQGIESREFILVQTVVLKARTCRASDRVKQLSHHDIFSVERVYLNVYSLIFASVYKCPPVKKHFISCLWATSPLRILEPKLLFLIEDTKLNIKIYNQIQIGFRQHQQTVWTETCSRRNVSLFGVKYF